MLLFSGGRAPTSRSRVPSRSACPPRGARPPATAAPPRALGASRVGGYGFGGEVAPDPPTRPSEPDAPPAAKPAKDSHPSVRGQPIVPRSRLTRARARDGVTSVCSVGGVRADRGTPRPRPPAVISHSETTTGLDTSSSRIQSLSAGAGSGPAPSSGRLASRAPRRRNRRYATPAPPQAFAHA